MELPVLDERIRDWVLLPICLVMFLQGILRQNISILLKEDRKSSFESIVRAQLLKRSQRLRLNGKHISAESVAMRKRDLVNRALLDRPKTDDDMANPMMPGASADPSSMMGGMFKQQLMMILPNMILMGWVSYFFSGFIVAKLPFALSDRFKQMVQRGVNLTTLDASYVTSLSLYILLLVGMRGLFTLVLGSGNQG